MMLTTGTKIESDRPVFGRNDQGEPICASQKRNKPVGDICHDTKLMPNGRCRRHGGLTPRGFASASTKSGRYSKDLPTNLVARYKEASEDTELLSLHADIALAEARTSDLLQRLRAEVGLSDLVSAAGDQLSQALEGGNVKEIQQALDTVKKTTKELQDLQSRVWREIEETTEAKRKLIVSESRRLMQMHQMVRTDEVLLVLGTIQEIVLTRVTNPQERQIIGSELRKIYSKPE